MSDSRRSRRQPPSRLVKRQTTLVVPPTAASASFTLYQGNGVNTATDLASAALPTQLVFDSSVVGTPVGAATTGNAATMTVSPVFVGSAKPKSDVATPSSSEPTPSQTVAAFKSKPSTAPVIPIIMALVSAGLIAALLLFLCYRRRKRQRGSSHSRVSSFDVRGPPAGDVLRKLGSTGYDTSDPFSDAHAAPAQHDDPFADPEKGHARAGSDSFLSIAAPRQPYTHAASASTGSSASSKVKKRDMEEARQKDMMALNNLVKALDVKEREGRDRKSLPPVELFKAALVR